MWTSTPGASDIRRAADQLSARLPALLAPLARLAYNYAWSWTSVGPEIFAAVDRHRWRICQHNPVRLLLEAPASSLDRAAADHELLRRAQILEEQILAAPAPGRFGALSPQHPVAFFCAEYGVHRSLPIYAGGLGVLAGDILKAASDRAFPMVAVGLLYRQGYFRQRIDVSGWQHEYWIDTDPELMPAALVTTDGIEPLTVSVPIRGRDVNAQVWRVDVGRVPLYLLDTERAENSVIDRWICSRLYLGDRDGRLAQYALLGMGGARALAAMGIEPGAIHLNEGHAGLAPFAFAEGDVANGMSVEEALKSARGRTVFTTHTPVPAGNETYTSDEIRHVFAGLPERLGLAWDDLERLGRVDPEDLSEPFGMSQLGIRMSRSVNGVSRRHGATARAMWQGMYPGRAVEAVPIGHVTNGVHVSTWMAPPMRDLIQRHAGPDWSTGQSNPAAWSVVDQISDQDLWAVRCRLRRDLVYYVREKATADRLARGEPPSYVELAARAFDPNHLTIGFARRLAAYKRLHLLTLDLQRSLALLAGEHPLQILLAGKAHPQDDGAKRIVQAIFDSKGAPLVGERIAYLHDYDMELARHLVAGCDVWVNVPRPPLEASGTSGMKAAVNGGLNLSVLDGWWAEAYDGENGWAIDGEADGDDAALDQRHATELLDLLEQEVVPLFYDRDADGVPRGWLKRVRAAIRTGCVDFSAARMLDDYGTRVYVASGEGHSEKR